MKIIRRVNMSATNETGGEFIFSRDFIGPKEIVKSLFMSTNAIVNREPDTIGRGKFYITNRHSYFIFKKDEKNV